jgi:hypothetical protein
MSSSRGRSPSTPRGAPARTAPGLGTRMEVDPELIVPDPAKSLDEGAIAPWAGGHVSDYFDRLIEALAETVGFRTDTPWERLPQKAETPCSGPGPAGPRPLQEPLRPRAVLLHELRGRDHLRGAPPRRGRVRLKQGEVRGLHARGALPVVQGRAPQAGLPGRHDRRQLDRRATAPSRSASWPRTCSTWSCPIATWRSRGSSSRKSTPASASCSTWASTTCPSTAPPRPSPAARRSGSGSPPRSAPAWWACCTCSTSRRSGCTSATTRSCSDAAAAARPRQHAHRRRARRGHDPRRRLGGRHRPRRRRARRARRRQRHRRRPAQERVA